MSGWPKGQLFKNHIVNEQTTNYKFYHTYCIRV